LHQPAGVSFQVLRGQADRNSALIGTFDCGVSLAIEHINGTIAEYLDCEPGELQGYGWRPFLHPDDRTVIFEMAQALQAGRAGSYDCRAQARRGEPVLHLRVRTLVLQQQGYPSGAEGLIDLLDVESRRAIVLP
jgi:PAS domain-containing protein